MSNIGLEKRLPRTASRCCGRRLAIESTFLEEMVKRDAQIGGEQSGHVIFRDYATTGDGILTALRVLEIVRCSGRSLDELAGELRTFPQLLVNVRVKNKRPLDKLPGVQNEIRRAEEAFGENGRVVVRFSGTEPLARNGGGA